jgi:hypothetical protein
MIPDKLARRPSGRARVEVDLDRFEQSKIPEETKELERLVPKKW